jgi:hypothetical protein
MCVSTRRWRSVSNKEQFPEQGADRESTRWQKIHLRQPHAQPAQHQRPRFHPPQALPLAHDKANSPHALAIVRVEQARSAPPAPTPGARPRAAKPAAKPGNTAIPVLAASPMLQVQASLPALSDELPVLFMRPPAMPDPDVDLIAAILLLSPDRAPPHLPDCRGALFELNACATMLP